MATDNLDGMEREREHEYSHSLNGPMRLEIASEEDVPTIVTALNLLDNVDIWQAENSNAFYYLHY